MKINPGATPYSAPTVKFFSVTPRQCLMVSNEPYTVGNTYTMDGEYDEENW